MVNVIIAEPNPLLRTGLRSVLERHADVRVAVEAEHEDRLAAALGDVRHQVLLIGLGLLRQVGAAAFRELRRANPACGVLVHSYEWDLAFGAESRRYGAAGYISHECTAADLYAAVLDVAAGRPFVTRSLGAELAAAACFRAGSRCEAALSARERYVFKMLAIGVDAPGIAAQLGLRVRDVVECKWRIVAKVDVPEAGQLVRHAIAQARRDWPWPEVAEMKMEAETEAADGLTAA